jgi:ferrous iron transport protein A
MIILLSDLPDGINATVHSVGANDPLLNEDHLRRLGELGFLPGEPVQVVRRGPGDREPLAVVVGDSFFALRLAEARCVSVMVSD